MLSIWILFPKFILRSVLFHCKLVDKNILEEIHWTSLALFILTPICVWPMTMKSCMVPQWPSAFPNIKYMRLFLLSVISSICKPQCWTTISIRTCCKVNLVLLLIPFEMLGGMLRWWRKWHYAVVECRFSWMCWFVGSVLFKQGYLYVIVFFLVFIQSINSQSDLPVALSHLRLIPLHPIQPHILHIHSPTTIPYCKTTEAIRCNTNPDDLSICIKCYCWQTNGCVTLKLFFYSYI